MRLPKTASELERELELAFKRGFDAGIEHQKKAAPPPKARELAKQLEAARDAAAEAFDAALTAFAQVQEQLAAVTAEREELRALLTETPLEVAVRDAAQQEVMRRMFTVLDDERKHCRCGRLRASMNDYMSAPPDLRDDKLGLCWAEWTGEACR